MKKSSILLSILFVLGACMLTPMTPPPPALDPTSPEGIKLIGDLVANVNEIISSIGTGGGNNFEIDQTTGDLTIPSESLGDSGIEDLLAPNDGDGGYKFDLHTIIVQDDGSQRIVYTFGDTYLGAVYSAGPPKKLTVQNTPLINYDDIAWSGTPVFEFEGNI